MAAPTETPPTAYARSAGLLYLIIIVLGIYSELFVLPTKTAALRGGYRKSWSVKDRRCIMRTNDIDS